MEVKTKYSIGDKFYAMRHNKPAEHTVSNINIEVYDYDAVRIKYRLIYNIPPYSSYDLVEEACIDSKYYKTKKDLINSLIKDVDF